MTVDILRPRQMVQQRAARAPLPRPAQSGPRPGLFRSGLFWPAVLGLLGTALVAGAAPTWERAPHAWRFAFLSERAHAGALGWLFFEIGIVVVCVAWCLVVRAAKRRPEVHHRWLIVVFAIWVVPLLAGPPQLSRDVYSYAAQGEMVVLGRNPTTEGPSVLPNGTYRNMVDPVWKDAPAPYGPLTVGVFGLAAAATRHSPAATLMVLRLLAFFGILVTAFLTARLAAACGTSPAYAVALGILNPVILLHVVGGAHNEALVLPLLVGGVLACVRGRRVLGIVLTAGAGAAKLPAAAAVLVQGWAWAGKGATFPARVRRLAAAGALAVATLAVIVTVSGFGWGWVGALRYTGRVWSSLAPTTLVGLAVNDMVRLMVPGIDPAATVELFRIGGMIASVVLTVAIVRRTDQLGEVRAIGLALLVLALLGPVVYPWYLAGGLVLLAAAGPARLEPAVIVVSIASCLTLPANAATTLHGVTSARPWAGLLFVGAVAAIARYLTLRLSDNGVAGISGISGHKREDVTGETPSLAAVTGTSR